jgi:guanidinopropionase
MTDPAFQPHDSGKTPRFQEIATFMRAARAAIAPPLEIALVGVPLDLGATYRVGARHGPEGVRQASRLVRAVNPTTGVAPFALCNIADVGDSPIDPLSLERSVQRIEAYFRQIAAIGAAPISIGGDHTVPLPILRAIAAKEPVGLLHFDAHTDFFDDFMGTKINHATFVRRAIEERLLDPKRIIQIGLRGTRYGQDDIDWGRQAGVRMITYDDYEAMGRAAVIAAAKTVLAGRPTYVSIDVDGLDPTEAPGTGVPEPGGLSMRDMQVILRSMTGAADFVGGDVCEIIPSLDPTGITCVNAANLMFEIACLVARARADRAKRR